MTPSNPHYSSAHSLLFRWEDMAPCDLALDLGFDAAVIELADAEGEDPDAVGLALSVWVLCQTLTQWAAA